MIITKLKKITVETITIGLYLEKQDATLTQGPPRDAPNIWVPWK